MTRPDAVVLPGGILYRESIPLHHLEQHGDARTLAKLLRTRFQSTENMVLECFDTTLYLLVGVGEPPVFLIAGLPPIAIEQGRIAIGAACEGEGRVEFHRAHTKWFAHAERVTVVLRRVTLRLQNPAERTEFRIGQVLEVDAELEHDRRIERIQARVLHAVLRFIRFL